MKAIVQDGYGSPDVLELREIDRPTPGDDQLLVRVHAAGVDPGGTTPVRPTRNVAADLALRCPA